jgi:(S)-sulfolactate dehydrogenase
MNRYDTDVLVVEDVWGAPMQRLASTLRVDYQPDLWKNRTALAERAGRSRALVVRNRTQVDAELLASSSLLVVARAGTGLDNIDLAAAERAGIVVVAALGANARSVAEHTMALTLALARNIAVHDRATRAGEWTRTPGIELAGCTWGLLGAGATGQAVGRLVSSSLGGRVLGYDMFVRHDDPRVRDANIGLVSLARVIEESDVISVHLPASPETRGMVNREFLGRMRPHALLVNVGRGEVVDEPALVEALTAGKIAGAALDVRASEPPTPGALELMDNVVLTPHVAGITRQAQDRVLTAVAADLEALFRGEEGSHAVGSLQRIGRPVAENTTTP